MGEHVGAPPAASGRGAIEDSGQQPHSHGSTVRWLHPAPRWEYARVPDGDYEARVVDQATGMYFFGRQPKVVVWWMLTQPGYMETVLPAYYAVPGLSGKPRRHGRYQRIGMRSRLMRDLAVMLGRRPPRDYFPIDDVCDRLYRVRTRTVSQTHQQDEIPDVLRYSVVDRVQSEVS